MNVADILIIRDKVNVSRRRKKYFHHETILGALAKKKSWGGGGMVDSGVRNGY